MSEHYDESEQEPDYDSLNNYWTWAIEAAIEEAEMEDGIEALAYGHSERRSGEHIPFHPLFPACFLRRVGGEPSDPYTVPSFALEDWLQTTFHTAKERPTFDYLIGLLEDAFSVPSARVQKAIAWLRKMRATRPPWPARYETRKGMIISRVAFETTPDEAPAATIDEKEPVATVDEASTATVTEKEPTAAIDTVDTPLLGDPTAQELRAYQSRVALLYIYSDCPLNNKSGIAAAYGWRSDNSVYKQYIKFYKVASRRAGNRKLKSDIEAIMPWLSPTYRKKAQEDIKEINNRLGIDDE